MGGGTHIGWVVTLILSCQSMSYLLGTAVHALKVMLNPMCDYVVQIEEKSKFVLHPQNFTKFRDQHSYCTLLVTTDHNLLLVVDVAYSPARAMETWSKRDCETDYLHIGNDLTRVDVDLMTSYKLCSEDVRQEIFSMNNTLWIVLKATRTPAEFLIKISAHTPVTCLSEQFRCSPIKCVHREFICDGETDCQNGHDEFCLKLNLYQNSAVFPNPCFRCGDGTCIQPRLLRSEANYGRALWYLCDGFSHCPDSWDERKDICLHLKVGRVGAVVQCVPSDLQFGINGSVLMWNDIQCDGTDDCYHGEDERNCNDNNESKLRADPATLGAVIGVLVTACIVISLTYRLKVTNKPANRPSTSSTVDTRCTQCTSGDNERSEGAVSERGGSETLPANVYIGVTPTGDCDLCVDDIEGRLNINLKHTII